MHSRDELQRATEELKRKYGDWTYDIPLPFDVWTRGNLGLPHTRLKRIVQMVSDLAGNDLSQTRILDLGCLDGMFSIEFAKQGARTVGVEIREANIQKAIFCKEALGLHHVEFRQDDVRNISVDSYGRFDAIVCSGILYHLEAADAVRLIEAMYEMATRLVVIDTHVALEGLERFVHGGEEYWGRAYREHSNDATPEEKSKKLWASADNPTSFWFTRPSLINLLSGAGFSSVYECFIPAHVNFGQPGLEHRDRCTFAAVKGAIRDLTTSPTANSLREKWPEESLRYAPMPKKRSDRTSWFKTLFRRLASMMNQPG